MNLLKIALTGSLLSLANCAAIAQLSPKHRAEEADKRHFDYAHGYVDAAQKLEKPGSLEELETAYDKWQLAFNHVQEFTKDENRCTGEHKTSDICKLAAKDLDLAGKKMIETIENATDYDPEPGSAFPANAIVDMQRRAAAEQLGVDKSLATVAERWKTFWDKKLATSGARNAIRKLGTGTCFFADGPHGKEVQPELVFGPESEELFVRCISPQPLSTFQRTDNDQIVVNLITGIHGDRDQDNETFVKSFPIEVPAGESADISVSMSAVMKTIKSDINKRDAEKGFRNFVLEARYVVTKKTGSAVHEDAWSHQMMVEDTNSYTTIARGFALFELDAKPQPKVEQVAEAAPPPVKKHAKKGVKHKH